MTKEEKKVVAELQKTLKDLHKPENWKEELPRLDKSIEHARMILFYLREMRAAVKRGNTNRAGRWGFAQASDMLGDAFEDLKNEMELDYQGDRR